MNFLIIVVTVLMVRQGEWIRRIQRDDWFDHWLKGLSQMTGQKKPWLALVLVVGAPAFALALLIYVLADYWWITFAINAAVLLYAIGRGHWHDECDKWVKIFSERDMLIVKQKIAESGEEPTAVTDDQVESTWVAARSHVLYHQLDGFYTVVFWFFIVGAPAALFYRLLHLYQPRHKQSEAIVSDVNLLLWMIEWLPVRVMAMLFCLVGNFTTGFWVLKQILLDGVLTSVDTLARCADAALFLDGSVDDDEILDEVPDDKKTRIAKMIERMESRAMEQKTMGIMRRYSVELQALLQRSEWAFLVVIALIALV
jgi:AmpE protein